VRLVLPALEGVTHMATNKKLVTSGLGSIEVTGEDKLLRQLDKFKLSRKERSAIVEAAIPIAEKHLYDSTPYDEFEDVHNKKLYGKSIGHLRDHITHKPNQFIDGGTELGFEQKAYPIAVWTDWGTYRQPAQFWFEKSVETMPYDQIFAAQTETAKAILKAKGL